MPGSGTEARQEWQLLVAAVLHSLEQVPVGVCALQLQQGSPAWVQAVAGLQLQLAALPAVATLLNDLWDMKAEGPADALPDDAALQSGAIVEALAAALPHLHGVLAAVAAAGSGGSSRGGGGGSTFSTPEKLCWQETYVQEIAICIDHWAFVCSFLPHLAVVPLPLASACQAAATAAEVLLRPGGGNEPFSPPPPAGSPGVVGCSGLPMTEYDLASLRESNAPELLALTSMWQADWLVRSATPEAAALPANRAWVNPAAVDGGAQQIAAGGRGSDERLHSGRPVAAAPAVALWSAALTAFKHRWAAPQSPFADAAAAFGWLAVTKESGDMCGTWMLVGDRCEAAVPALLAAGIEEGVPDSQRWVPPCPAMPC